MSNTPKTIDATTLAKDNVAALTGRDAGPPLHHIVTDM